MISYVSQVLNIILVFILTLVMNWTFEMLTADSGYVRKGAMVSIGYDRFIPIEIENYKSSSINGIKILMPLGLEEKEIVSSKPVKIEKVDSTASPDEFNVFNISEVTGEAVTRILVPLKFEDSSCCQFLNAKDLKLEIKNDEDVVDPVKSAFLKGAQTAAIYSIFIFLLAIWMRSKIEGLQKNLEDLSGQLENSSDKIDRLTESLTEIRKIYKRQRVFLLRRVSDYGKEVEFWRDTLRRILVEQGCDRNSTKKMLREISKALGTLSTHGNTVSEYEDFEALREVIESIDDSAGSRV
ncbi:hypothetical protein EHN06_06805 [Marinobacter sp. NP-4(2019)]|uniref:hypothetical protein n=1 Tax=Marinobacter sp. NP-4(2019) TaxID=2488665 RepID=UPI000FC3EF43|nr:hypothetical protein [Marinobacter sp. NP-4(2019)]AZT83281.1 hypothetical protein EHN06_06805 [Marinobacter sp. NP-4(2019)]